MKIKIPKYLYGSWLLSLALLLSMSAPIMAQSQMKTDAQIEAERTRQQSLNPTTNTGQNSNRPMAFPEPYCEIADATEVIVEEITAVDFVGTEITNEDTDTVLIDKTDVVVEITAGDTYTISVEGNTKGNFTTNIVAFIDWNQNGVLDDAGEIYEVGTLENSTGDDGVSVSLDITVPTDAVVGQTRVRITKTYFDEDSDPIINPCGIEFDPWGMGIFPGYGQALDFTVNVGGGGTFPSPYCGITNGDDIIVHKITEVDFAGTNITNEDGVSPLIDKTDVVVNVAVNDTYTLVVEDDAPQNYQSKAVAFIDWNQNGILDDAGEIYELGTLEYPSGHVNMDVTIPSDAVLGETRIRIVKTYFNEFSAAVINPCAIEFEQSSGIWPSLGQALDFTLNIEEDSGGGHAYCIPEGTNSGRYIDNFSTTGGSQDISNMGSGFSSGGYGDFYDTHTVEQAVGEDVSFEVDIVGGTAGFRIWVDWNQDGVFDTTEEVAWNSSGYLTNHTGSFTVPADALEGDTRMRIVSHWLSTTGDVDPCETGFTYGEFEDYKFTVSGGGGGGQVYCEPAGTNSSYYIDSFSTTGATTNISNLGSGFSPGGYGDYYDTHTVAQAAGEDVQFEVDIEGGTAGFRIWVDWNQDGVFDITEEVAWNSSGYSSNHTGSFTVPADALEGDTRMRIASHWLSSSGDVDPCETGFNYGEFEDYKFTVEGSGGAGCEWTVIVEDTSWGDEVEWELREDGGGNILLSGGGYGNGYYDEQTVTAEGPLEFWITNDGFFGDNTPTYSVSNGTEVLVSGTLTTADTLIFSDLNCDSGTAGQTCDDAITVTDLPYTDAGNTADYGNFYSNGDVPDLAPDAVTNGTGSPFYLSGDEVVYAYTPAEDEVLNISTTNDDDWIGLWAFTGCPFTSTVGYHTSIDGDTRLIEELPVTAGETYYFVISTWAPPESTDYTILIERVGGGGGSSDCISTIYDGGNNGASGGAVYFDVTVGPEDIELTSFDLNTDLVGTGFSVDVYTIDGTHVGNETNQGAWTMRTSGSGTSAGEGSASTATLDDTFVLSANTTYGLALVLDSTHSHYYTNGDGTNEHFENSDLALDLGAATNIPFEGTVFTPRVFNGGLCYNVGGGTPPGGDCSLATEGVFENGKSFTKNLDRIVANDIVVPAGQNMLLEKINLNAFIGSVGAGVTASDVDVYVYEDNGGMPGAMVTMIPDIVPTSQTEVGDAFDFQIWDVEIDFAAVELDGQAGAETTYWVGVSLEAIDGSNVFWEFYSDATAPVVGHGLAYDDGVVGFIIESENEGVYTFHATCSDIGEPSCDFDITSSIEPITRVVLADIDNSSSAVVNGSPALEDFTSIEGTMSQGYDYDIALEGNTDGPWTNYFTVWIDWDQNGVWDADEMYEIGSIVNSTGTDGLQATGTITVPADAPLGSTKMRVIKSFGSSPTDPCGQYSFGQGEDYTIIVDDEIGIDDQSSTAFTYYPNPTNGVVNITANKDISSVSVFNILGQQVVAQNSLDNGQVDLSSLATGTYVFRVMFEDGSLETFKVLKE